MPSSVPTSCGFCRPRAATNHAPPKCWASIHPRCIANCHATESRRTVSKTLTPMAPAETKLSVLVPVYNERETVADIIERVHCAPISPVQLEIVVGDDCSTDGSRDVLQQLASKGRIHKLHLQPANKGKGAAIRQ